MATQKCPKCGSKRVRQGYRPTSILLKILFTYHLLCDECNWEFTGFGLPGTVAKKTRKRKKTNVATENENLQNDDNLISEILSNRRTIEGNNSVVSHKKKDEMETVPQIIPEVGIETEEEADFDSNDSSSKRRKVKKKVRVKFF